MIKKIHCAVLATAFIAPIGLFAHCPKPSMVKEVLSTRVNDGKYTTRAYPRNQQDYMTFKLNNAPINKAGRHPHTVTPDSGKTIKLKGRHVASYAVLQGEEVRGKDAAWGKKTLKKRLKRRLNYPFKLGNKNKESCEYKFEQKPGEKSILSVRVSNTNY